MSEKWIKSSFDKCFELHGNNTLARAQLSNVAGRIQDVHYGDVLVKYFTVVDCDIAQLPSIISDAEHLAGKDYAKDGDIVFADTAEDDTVGKAVEIINVGGRKVVSGLHTIFARPKIQFAPMWLGYYVNSNGFHSQILPYVCGSKVSSISRTNIRKTHVVYPQAVATQRHIAEVLSTCDEVIEKSERAAEKYRQIKAGMLTDLLTRGLDDRGKLRPPPSAAPELYKDSELGPIPREWEVKRLGDVCSVQLGKMLDAAKNVGIEKPYIGNRSVQWGHFDLADIETVRLTEQDLGRFRLQKGDLIVCEGGEVGRCAIWNDELSECYYQKALHRVRLLAGVEYSIPFLAYCFQYFASLDLFTPLVTQTSIAHLPKEKLERLPIFYFSLAEQRAIAERLAAVDERIAAEVKAAGKYRKVKAGLMEKLLTPPADAEIEDRTQEVAG